MTNIAFKIPFICAASVNGGQVPDWFAITLLVSILMACAYAWRS